MYRNRVWLTCYTMDKLLIVIEWIVFLQLGMSKLSNVYGSTTDRGVVAYIYASQTRVQYCVRSDKLGSASEYITSPAIGLLIVPGYL